MTAWHEQVSEPDADFDRLIAEARQCRRCPLWQPARQMVFGEGPLDAEAMLVGEAPGDREDVLGHPFVGPAGHLLDRALQDVGLERKSLYLTNAVKHFKFEPRGKRRIHQSPVVSEIQACNVWLEAELALVKPKVIVALGSVAARGLTGHAVRIGASRGRPLPFGETSLLVTTHPSAILRMEEPEKSENYALFLEDLRLIPALIAHDFS